MTRGASASDVVGFPPFRVAGASRRPRGAGRSTQRDFERNVAEIREAQSRAEQASAAAQSCAGDARIHRGTRERWKLSRLSYDRAEHRDDIRCTIVTEADHGGRRELPVGWIDHCAAGGEWNPVCGGDPGRNMGFRVDGDGTRLLVKSPLLQRIGDGSVRPDNLGVDGARKRVEQHPCPQLICWKASLVSPDARSNDPVACNELWRQPAGDSKTDDAKSTTLDRGLKGGNELRIMIADH